ncbi:peptidoglycan/LPS O-acetylase OafA/YrhL [Bradyrhizobium sp. USDA 4501]
MGHNYKNYRPDIDGLRAVAVSLVVLGHAFPQYVPGGFVGVDIFFVISGYLITGIIYGDIQNGSFSLATFYARRIRRIFPALIVVLIAAFIAGWQLLMPSELVALGKEIAAGAGFSANLLFYSEGGYFDAAAQTKPLLHLWSLGIEEQFYLVWPLLLWALMRWRIAAAAPLALIFIASLVANILVVRTNPEAAFYQPFTRAWELAAGALVAVCLPNGFSAARDLLGWFALAVIASVTAFYSPSMTYPGIAAVAPVAAAAALIMSGRNRFLSTRTAVAIGLISYPLYLWHWPILVFAASFKGRPLTLAENGLAVGGQLHSGLGNLSLRRAPNQVRAVAGGAGPCGIDGGRCIGGSIGDRRRLCLSASGDRSRSRRHDRIQGLPEIRRMSYLRFRRSRV